MLTATLTLNNARTGKDEDLGELRIINTGEGTEKRGVYRVTLRRDHEDGTFTERWAFIEDWPRLSLGAWELLAEAIDALEGRL